ncbi:MAG: molybdopterin-dependent oxidoreductase [Deltaproteobacteria bacterium]|nr:molybdopterin-dependent oxidoreductase [Deltaproteobacteria bacterium]
MSEKKFTFCRVCEATCGLEVEVEDDRVVGIVPDPQHVVSQGYACVKGTRWASVQHSPDRVTQPLERVGARWVEVSWARALDAIAEKATQLIAQHGPQSFGHFVGSAGGANLLAPMFRGALFAGIGSNRMYGTGTCDTMNKFRVNEDMYGSPMRLAYPDVNRTEFMLIVGANPVVSGNTLYHLPRAQQRLGEIAKRGGRVVFVNPRRVESAAVGEHLFIRPDTDVYFLAAFCNELIRGGVDADRIARHMKNFTALCECVAGWTPERQEEVTGVSAGSLRDLVASHRAADGAALYMATGVNQGRSGTLCFWLLEAINAISGNLDRLGGTLMGEGLFDMARQVNDQPQMRTGYHRHDDLPTVSGQQPAGMLADDIEGGHVTGLIIEASNPLLACSNPDGRLERALEKLELLVCIDLFRNETANLADFILPAPTWLERSELPYALQSFAGCTPTPYITYGPAVVAPPRGVRHEWWIYTRLADAMGVRLFDHRLVSFGAKLAARLSHTRFGRFVDVPDMLVNGMLKKGGVPGTKQMAREHPHGLLLPENRGGNFLGTDRVLTADGKVDLAPEEYRETFLEQVETRFADEIANGDRLKLIGMREVRRMNTSSANSEQLVRDVTNYVHMSSDDAERIGVVDGDPVEVESLYGRIVIPVRVTDEMMPRTIAIPQCWGHARADGLRHAQKHPGVNSNLLAGDGYDNIEKLSGMSHLSGILVEVRRSPRQP